MGAVSFAMQSEEVLLECSNPVGVIKIALALRGLFFSILFHSSICPLILTIFKNMLLFFAKIL